MKERRKFEESFKQTPERELPRRDTKVKMEKTG
jgi:hypothetical protein